MSASRREFLEVSLIGGAALLIGFGCRAPEKTTTGNDAGELHPNGWVRIDPDGKVTLTVGKSEMGQGVRTSLPMILAEELDADFDRISLVQAMPGREFGRLGTGGSGSVRGSWDPLRLAGATARAMLVAAAAKRWKVEPSSCRTGSGVVSHPPSGRRATYGELAATAAKQPVPKDSPLKKASEFRLVGRSERRIDGPRIVRGTAEYGIDVRVPDLLFASVARCPTIGGHVRTFDASKAKRVEGVRDVIELSTGIAVVAENNWAAMKGRDALSIDWDDGPNARFDSRKFIAGLGRAADKPGFTMRKVGAGLEALDKASKTLEAKYVYPYYVHAPLEPMNCTAIVRDGRCEIHVPTQNPNWVQILVARKLGIPNEHVAVHTTLIGGGFGRRLNVDYAVEAAELAKALGKPVQILWTRQDDMRHGHFQMASVERLVGGLDAAGRLSVWGHRKASSFHNLGPKPTEKELKDPAYYQDSAWGVYDIPYDIPAIETDYVEVDCPIPIGPWRAVYSPASTFARECFVDELAHAAGRDPIAFRIEMLGGAEMVKAGELEISRPRLRRVIELARDKSGWERPLPNGRARGFACNVYDGETHVAYVAEVSVGRDGSVKVDRIVAAVDCGLAVNPTGVEQQMESGIVWALSSMLGGEATLRRGIVEQSHYGDYPVLRIDETPEIEAHIVPSDGERPWGMGEPPVSPLVPAVMSAIFAATGKRLRRIPVRPDDLA